MALKIYHPFAGWEAIVEYPANLVLLNLGLPTMRFGEYPYKCSSVNLAGCAQR